MKNLFTLIFGLLAAVTTLEAQQDAMFTKYMFNSLNYNPAYAGSADAMSITLLHRHQWWGIDGAPLTQNLTIHSPLKNDRIGLGGSIIYDQIGVTQQLGINGTYAYRIPLNGNANLALGLQGGILNWRSDWDQLNIREGMDPSFTSVTQPNLWLPNFGAGIYYSTRTFYLGFAAPHLVNHDLRKSGITPAMVSTSQLYRHYFLATGMAIRLSSVTVFKPSILWKNVGLFIERNAENNVSAPNEVDIDLSFFFYERFWIGGAFRTALEGNSTFDSIDLWAAYFLKNGLRIGVAYDYTLTELRGPAGGSYELMVGYDFNYKKSKIVTPRYF